MRRNKLQLYIHLVWSTHQRLNSINKFNLPLIFKIAKDKCLEKKCRLIQIGGTANHIHLLIELNPSTMISALVKAIKGFSSYQINRDNHINQNLKWQKGYGAFSVSPQLLTNVKKYIEAHDY